MFVAHAAPATPSAGRWRPRAGRSSPKMKSGSRIRFAPNPTIMQTIELTAFPSARMKNTNGGRRKKSSSLNATSCPKSFSHASWFRSPSFSDSAAECPAPTNTPNAPKSIITGNTSVSAAIASSPQP